MGLPHSGLLVCGRLRYLFGGTQIFDLQAHLDNLRCR